MLPLLAETQSDLSINFSTVLTRQFFVSKQNSVQTLRKWVGEKKKRALTEMNRNWARLQAQNLILRCNFFNL